MQALTTVAMSPLGDERALRFDVSCRHGSGRAGVHHEVVINPDWSVNTGHDLDAERIAVAFGGRASCLDVVDKLAPALRQGLLLRRRLVRPSIRRAQHGWVVTDGTERCSCARARTRTGLTLMTAAAAAGHERGAQHLSHKFGAPEKQLNQLLDQVAEAAGELELLPTHPEARALVLEDYGLVELWDAGIHPDRVIEIHSHLWPSEGAVPARLYLSFGTFLDAQDWSPWTGLGLPVLDIEQLVDSRFHPRDLVSLSALTSRTPRYVGSHLATWLRVGCQPDLEDLDELLTQRGMAVKIPSSRAIDVLHEELGTVWATRDQVGIVLAVVGTRGHALRALREGARGTRDALRYLSTKGLL